MNRLFTLIFAALLLGLGVTSPAQAQDVTTDLLGRINGLRGSLGLPPYALNGALAAAARNQAQWMAQTGQISHTQDNGSTPSSRAQAAGYPSSWVSENIYMGSSATAASAFTWWSNSPIHYRGMTNANYTEIGIGWASGPAFSGSTAFVLVFGNPTGYTAPRRAASTGSGQSSAASGPPALPPYVVGVDNNGYIMHEVQPGHTMGEIALFYGYTWDDLPEIRAINDLTEEEARNRLEVGSILLIPPWEGTYTPTPGGPNEALPDDAEASSNDADAAPGLSATPSPIQTPTATATPRPVTQTPAGVATSAVVPEWVVETSIAQDATHAATSTTVTPSPPVREIVQNPPTVAPVVTLVAQAPTIEGGSSWTAATVTPVGQTPVTQASPTAETEVALALVDESAVDSGDNGPNPLLIAGAALVVGVLFGFGVAMLRNP